MPDKMLEPKGLAPTTEPTAYDTLVTMSGHGLRLADLLVIADLAASVSHQRARLDEIKVYCQAARAWQKLPVTTRTDLTGGDSAAADSLAGDLIAFGPTLTALLLDRPDIVKTKANDGMRAAPITTERRRD